jgi:hypothetical protein
MIRSAMPDRCSMTFMIAQRNPDYWILICPNTDTDDCVAEMLFFGTIQRQIYLEYKVTPMR